MNQAEPSRFETASNSIELLQSQLAVSVSKQKSTNQQTSRKGGRMEGRKAKERKGVKRIVQ